MLRASILAILAAALLTVLTACDSRARTTTTVNGKKIVLIGGNTQSVSQREDGADIKVDGHAIKISGNTLTVDGTTSELPEFKEMEITLDDGKVTIELDGKAYAPS
jgi:uncharacterized protein with ACT and thioredoxin-like domain